MGENPSNKTTDFVKYLARKMNKLGWITYRKLYLQQKT